MNEGFRYKQFEKFAYGKVVKDFHVKYPNISSEWNYEKNHDLKPEDVFRYDERIVWWKCINGHEWEEKVIDRVEKQNMCPFCHQSFLERHTEKMLVKYGYEYKKQVKFKHLVGVNGGKLSYDFALYNNGKPYTFIECQGLQHYKPIEYFGGKKQYIKQMIHDACKQFYAQVREIPLITIPYVYDEMDIEEMFQR